MQSSDRILARRYGKALFLAAAGRPEETRLQADLLAAERELAESLPQLRDPRVSAADKKKRIRTVLAGKTSALTLRYLELLIDKKRFHLLAASAEEIGELIAATNNTDKAVARCARPLSARDRERLEKGLSSFAGKKIEVAVQEDPEIIGGLVVRLGDWVIDSSLRGQLRSMREAFHGN